MKYQGIQFRNEGTKKAEIDIEGFIGWDEWDAPEEKVATKEKMKAELKRLAGLKVDEIVVNINSYGGDVNHGISIHDLLRESKARIITKVNGMTASAATIIAMAGDERLMSDNALFLVHNASTWAWGDKNDIATAVQDLEKIDDRIANIYAKATGKDIEEMTALMNEEKGRGKWLTAAEAQELGFVTQVFEPLKAAAHFSDEMIKMHRLPALPEKFKDTFNNQIKKENNMRKPELKKLAAAAKFEELEVNDGGVFLATEQAQEVENLIDELQKTAENYSGLQDGESIQGLRDQIKTLGEEKANAEKTSQTLTAEVDRLTAENEKLSKQTVIPTGATTDGDQNDENPVDEEAQHFYSLSKMK